MEDGSSVGPGCPRLQMWFLICATVVFGAVQISLVRSHGSIIPFWDEWDVQGQKLFRPLLAGTLTLQDIIGPHNEHRPAAGRLVWLLGFTSAGYWDTVWMMLLSVLIRAATFFCLARSLVMGLNGWRFLLAAGTVLALFALPFGWENALWGMQSATYLLLFFGVAANLCLAGSAALSGRWVLGTLLAIGSYFCMASGAITLVPAILVAVLRFARGERRSRADLIGMAVHLCIVAACLAGIPKLEYQDNIAAATFAVFWTGLVKFASWPGPEGLPAALFFNLPAAMVLVRLILAREPVDRAAWAPVMVVLWVWGNIAILAYGRGGSTEVASRHTDILLLGTAINCALCVRLTEGWAARWARAAAIAAAGLWLAIAAWMVCERAQIHIPDGLAWRRGTVMVQTQKVTGFYISGDAGALRGQPHAFVPYPDPDRLARDLSDPLLRPVLPSALTGNFPQGTISDHALARAVHRSVAVVKATLLRNGTHASWIGLGLLMLLALAILLFDRRSAGLPARGRPSPDGRSTGPFSIHE